MSSRAQQCLSDGMKYLFFVPHAIDALRRGDDYLAIDLHSAPPLSDADLSPLLDELQRRPDAVAYFRVGFSSLTDTTGVRLAAWIARSQSVKSVVVPHGKLGVASFLAIADALSVNKSLRVLVMLGNAINKCERATIESAFARSLRLNNARPLLSHWYIFDLMCLYDQLYY